MFPVGDSHEIKVPRFCCSLPVSAKKINPELTMFPIGFDWYNSRDAHGNRNRNRAHQRKQNIYPKQFGNGHWVRSLGMTINGWSRRTRDRWYVWIQILRSVVAPVTGPSTDRPLEICLQIFNCTRLNSVFICLGFASLAIRFPFSSRWGVKEALNWAMLCSLNSRADKRGK